MNLLPLFSNSTTHNFDFSQINTKLFFNSSNPGFGQTNTIHPFDYHDLDFGKIITIYLPLIPDFVNVLKPIIFKLPPLLFNMTECAVNYL